jgi:hypothetical protein
VNTSDIHLTKDSTPTGDGLWQNLFCIQCSGTEYKGTPWTAYGMNISPEQLEAFGKKVGADGKLWILEPDNAEPLVGLTAPGKKHYYAGATQQKYLSYFEVYVKQQIPGITNLPIYETAGHAFWGLKTDAPDEAMQRLSPSLNIYANNCWGFYPHGALCGTNGILANDNGHGYDVKRVFYIGFPDLISGLQFTRRIGNAPPIYCAISYSCISATREAGQNVGVALPYEITPQMFGMSTLLKYPGPLIDNTPRYPTQK